MMPEQQPRVGDDVTALMGHNVGDDVSALFADSGDPELPSQRSTLDTALQYSGLKGLARLVYGDEGGNLPAAGGTVGALVGGVPGAALGGATGVLARDLIRANAGDPRTTGSPLEAATEVWKGAAVQGGFQKIATLAPAALTGLGKNLYQRALKPTQALADKARGGVEQLVQTGLDEGITVSKGGLRKVGSTLEGLDDQVAQQIAGSGKTIDPSRVLRQLQPTVREFADQVNPGADLKAIGAEGKAFAERYLPGQIPIEKAQALKQGTYRRLAKDFGKVSAPSAEAQKALARGLRQEIAAAEPGIAPLNDRMSQLLDLRKGLARTRLGNNDAFSLRDAVAAAGGSKGALLASLMQRAPLQSLGARGAYRAGQSIDPDTLAAAVRALVASLPKQEQE